MTVALLVACQTGEDGDEDAAHPENCSTNQTSYADEGADMEPGGDCIGCHARDEGPSYTIAGTVMGASHDDDRCVGTSGVTVEITEANGNVISLDANSVGTFFYQGPLATPYTAKVVSGGQELAMATPQSDGNCASCHTAQGANSAPGRILAP
jgi:mono/diheme cytochrome c family protein